MADQSDATEIRAFLIADVRGYTLFTHERGDEAAAKLAGRFAAVARTGVEARGGTVIELRGDEALAVFSSPRQAIRAAVELQSRFVDETLADPSLPLTVGIGLDAGEAVPLEGGYRGGALNLAARLCGLAGPGECLGSQEIVHLARRVEGITYTDQGEVELKGLATPVRVIAIASEGDDTARRLATVAPAPLASKGKRGKAPAQTPKRWTVRRMVVPILAVLLIAAIAIPLIRSRGGQEGLAGLDANSVGIMDVETGRLVQQVQLGSRPGAIAFGEGAVWVANPDAGTVTRLDPTTGQVVDTIPVGDDPAGLAIGEGAIWVANNNGPSLMRISPATNQVVDTIEGVGHGPMGVAVGSRAVWVANSLDDTVSRLDPDSGTEIARIPVGDRPTSIVVDGDTVWVTDSAGGTVSRIDAETGAVQLIHVGNGPVAVAAGPDGVWVANQLDGTVSLIDPERNSVHATVAVGEGPSSVAVTPAAVWVTNEYEGTVTRIDPASNGAFPAVHLGNAPQMAAVVGDQLWVTARAGSASHRGGTLRIVSKTGLDSIDPGLTTAVQSLSVLPMTNDGLVAFKRVGGSAGSALVPDLATEIPSPTDGGRTYVFRIRTGLTYSTGEPIRPSDFQRAIERHFRIDGPFKDQLIGIVGADQCPKPSRPCDLSAGIEAEDDAGTVIFHLREPDPDFLYKLTQTYAFAVPDGTPDRDVGTMPMPATGPYMIQTFEPGRRIILTRNPSFVQWSAAAKPDGFVDRIEWTFGVEPDDAVTRVERGDADWMFEDPPPEREPELLTRFAGQVLIVPGLYTYYMSLNLSLPPFNDRDVRRALNFAVDRQEVAALFGARGRLTCQVLPPNFTGYAPYCPYTLPPSMVGTWTAPDLDRAKRLVRDSGVKGFRVEVWTNSDLWGGVAVPVGEYFVRLLRTLGFDARLHQDESGVFDYFGTLGDPKKGIQIAAIGMGSLYPSGFGFLSGLRCGAFHTGFCDRAVDALLDEALQAQVRDPSSAQEFLARAEHAIVDEAPWVPLVSPRGVYPVSARVVNVQVHPAWLLLLDQLWLR